MKRQCAGDGLFSMVSGFMKRCAGLLALTVLCATACQSLVPAADPAQRPGRRVVQPGRFPAAAGRKVR